METTRSSVPPELRALSDATRAYLSVLRDAAAWAEQEADVNRIVRPDYARQLDSLGADLHNAQADRRVGTPASIARVVAELLGEV